MSKPKKKRAPRKKKPVLTEEQRNEVESVIADAVDSGEPVAVIKEKVLEKLKIFGLSGQDLIDIFNALVALGFFNVLNPFEGDNTNFEFYGFQG